MPALAKTSIHSNPSHASAVLPRLADKPIWSFATDGTVFDLAAPDQASVCFHEMAKRLSGMKRFNGLGLPISQHCVMGAQAIMNEGGNRLTAALFLFHDGHEWALGDIVRPVEDLFSALLASLAVREAIRLAKASWDMAIYRAAALPTPDLWTAEQRKAVKSMDDRMCRAEAIALFGPKAGGQFPKSAVPKTTGALRPWGAAKAEEEFIKLANMLINEETIVHQAAIAAAARALR